MNQIPEDFFWVEYNGEKVVWWTPQGTKETARPNAPYAYKRCDADTGWSNMRGHNVEKIEAERASEIPRRGTYEIDISYIRRYMLDNDLQIGTVPKLYVDIETYNSGSIDSEKNPIISIAAILDIDGKTTELYVDGPEVDILNTFFQWTRNVGMIITYKGGMSCRDVHGFDIPYMATRWSILKHGKVTQDGIYDFDYHLRHCKFVDMYFEYRRQMSLIRETVAGGYTLENVAQKELNMGKIKYEGEIHDLSEDKLREYNMRDVELTRKLDIKFDTTDLEIEICRMVNGLLTGWAHRRVDSMSSMRITDNMFLKYAHGKKMVLPNLVHRTGEMYEGAYVKQPIPGIYHKVQCMDIKQMYPNIIINERISPDKDKILLPDLLKDLTTKRAEAKKMYKETNDRKYNLRQLVFKVLGNSVYGVLGNPACRIYNKDMAAAITKKGREIIQSIGRYCDIMGCRNLYTDTDSTYIEIGEHDVKLFERALNLHISPYVIEAAELYDSIIFVGDKSGGIKKRYAGMVDGELKIIGMAAVRNDYAEITREIQKAVLIKLLSGEEMSVVRQYLDNIRIRMMRGEMDRDLILVKRVKKYDSYKGNTPQKRALKQYMDAGYGEVPEVRYVVTKKGGISAIYEDDKIREKPDYKYYWDQVLSVVRPIMRDNTPVMRSMGTASIEQWLSS